jgi:exonuclease SbcD
MLQKIDNLLQREISKLDPDLPAVLAVHASISGATYGSERSIMLGQDLVLDQSALHAENFDYVAVGHIHRHQTVGRSDVPIVYPGSIERIDFGEVREEKGFVLVTIDDPGGGRITRGIDWAFQEDKLTRPFRELEINLRDLEATDLLNPTQAAINKIQKQVNQLRNGLQEAIVKLIVQLRPDQEGSFKEKELQRLLIEEMGVYHIAAIKREVDHVRRTRLAGLKPEELSPLQLLDKHLESRLVPAYRRELLLKYAAALINGAEPANTEYNQSEQKERQSQTIKAVMNTLF